MRPHDPPAHPLVHRRVHLRAGAAAPGSPRRSTRPAGVSSPSLERDRPHVLGDVAPHDLRPLRHEHGHRRLVLPALVRDEPLERRGQRLRVAGVGVRTPVRRGRACLRARACRPGGPAEGGRAAAAAACVSLRRRPAGSAGRSGRWLSHRAPLPASPGAAGRRARPARRRRTAAVMSTCVQELDPLGEPPRRGASSSAKTSSRISTGSSPSLRSTSRLGQAQAQGDRPGLAVRREPLGRQPAQAEDEVVALRADQGDAAIELLPASSLDAGQQARHASRHGRSTGSTAPAQGRLVGHA